MERGRGRGVWDEMSGFYNFLPGHQLIYQISFSQPFVCNFPGRVVELQAATFSKLLRSGGFSLAFSSHVLKQDLNLLRCLTREACSPYLLFYYFFHALLFIPHLAAGYGIWAALRQANLHQLSQGLGNSPLWIEILMIISTTATPLLFE